MSHAAAKWCFWQAAETPLFYRPPVSAVGCIAHEFDPPYHAPMPRKSSNPEGKPPGAAPRGRRLTPPPGQIPMRARKEMYEAFRAYTEEAIDTLVEIMRNDQANDSDRISATKEILSRGYGAVPNVDLVEVAFKHEHSLNTDALQQMSTAELESFQVLLTKLVKVGDDVIDAEVITDA